MGSSKRSQRKGSRKFRGNQYTKKSSDEPSVSVERPTTASKQKLDNVDDVRPHKDPCGENIILDVDCLSSLFSVLSCPNCAQKTLKVQCDSSSKMGCAVNLNLGCENCNFIGPSCSSSKKVGQFYEVNRRLVYAMKQIGCGYREADHFLSVMNLPPPPNPVPYNQHIKALLRVVEPLAGEIMRVSAHRVWQKTNSTECGVSVDGTWHRRGYSSLTGVVTAVSIDTGEVVDAEVLSKDCHGCRAWNTKEKSSVAYLNWKANHKCSINYKGSSTNMEPVGAGRIFERSVKTRGLEYTNFYGDGDSKSYSAVCELDPYSGKEILKKECIGHYQKRLGTALRKLKKSVKGIGGKGKLTDSKINRMQNYFGLALRNNTDSIESMSNAIWSTFYHLSAQDSHPLHTKCPKGKDSWCTYQRAAAQGKLASYKHKGGLPFTLLSHIKPIYERLTCPEMLKKCLHGKTQNNNESLHAMIWKRSPKTKFSGATSIKLSVYDAICHFNCGYTPELEVMRRMDINPGKFMAKGIEARNQLRVSESFRQSTPKQKQRRKTLRGAKKRKDDKTSMIEGVTYASGDF